MRCRGHCRDSRLPETVLPVMQSVAKRCDPAPGRSGITTPHQPSRVGSDPIVAPLFIGTLPTLPCRSWRFSRSAIMSMTKCRSAIPPTLQAAPSLLALVDSQIARRQRVSLATMAWDILSPDFAAIDIGEVDDRRTISTNPAPATNY
jgi:hypothetical protein